MGHGIFLAFKANIILGLVVLFILQPVAIVISLAKILTGTDLAQLSMTKLSGKSA